MGATTALGVLGVVSTVAVTIVTYLMIRQGKAAGEIAAGLVLLMVFLLFPVFAARRYLSRSPEQRPSARRLVMKLPIIFVAAPLFSALAFYALYPSPIAAVAVVAILVAANWIVFFRD